jgi:hypothetical protein
MWSALMEVAIQCRREGDVTAASKLIAGLGNMTEEKLVVMYDLVANMEGNGDEDDTNSDRQR